MYLSRSWIIALLLLAGCQQNKEQAPQPLVPQPEIVTPPSQNRCDTYDWERDTIFHTDAPFLEQVQLTGEEVSQKWPMGDRFGGCIASGLDDSFVGVFITDPSGKHWTACVCDTIEGAMKYNILHPDLNFDGHPDVLVDAFDGGVHGNCFSRVFLFDPQKQTFYHYPALELPNLSIDKQHRQFRARHYSSQAGGNCKWLYAWKKDTVELLGKVVFQGTLGEGAAYGTFESTIYQNGVAHSDSLFLQEKDAWRRFERALWKGFGREE
jgi:hypothetical protein